MKKIEVYLYPSYQQFLDKVTIANASLTSKVNHQIMHIYSRLRSEEIFFQNIHVKNPVVIAMEIETSKEMYTNISILGMFFINKSDILNGNPNIIESVYINELNPQIIYNMFEILSINETYCLFIPFDVNVYPTIKVFTSYFFCNFLDIGKVYSKDMNIGIIIGGKKDENKCKDSSYMHHFLKLIENIVEIYETNPEMIFMLYNLKWNPEGYDYLLSLLHL